MRSIYVALLLLFMFPCAADMEAHHKDLPPKKGDISKNIHIVFDKSCSMGMTELGNAYKEAEMLSTRGADEFNLAVTAFGENHARMPVVDKECSVGRNWMAMPSMDHYKNMMEWLTYAPVKSAASQAVTAFKSIIKENKKNVTVIVISDCDFTSLHEMFNVIAAARKDKKNYHFKIGFVNVKHRISKEAYDLIKKNKCWYVSTPPPPKPPKLLEKEGLIIPWNDDDFWK